MKSHNPNLCVSPISRLLEWRKKHPEEYRAKKLAGLRSSVKAANAARRIGRKYWPENWEKLRKQRRYQATPEHIRSLEWTVSDPNNKHWRFVNLAYFIRTHNELFDSSDLVWKRVGNGIRCRAYAGIARLRPTSKQFAPSWKGWRWIAGDSL